MLVCAVVQKYYQCFLKKKFFLVLILQSTCFICMTRKRKKNMEQQPHHVNERNQTKNKHVIFNLPHVLLFDLAHKQCNGIIKGWLR